MPKKNSNSKLPHPNPVPVTNQALTHTPHTRQNFITSDCDREESRRGASRRQIGPTRTHGALTSLSESTLHVGLLTTMTATQRTTGLSWRSVVIGNRIQWRVLLHSRSSRGNDENNEYNSGTSTRVRSTATAATTHWTSMKKISTSL